VVSLRLMLRERGEVEQGSTGQEQGGSYRDRSRPSNDPSHVPSPRFPFACQSRISYNNT
jgi:hypothetical protein